MNLRYKIPC